MSIFCIPLSRVLKKAIILLSYPKTFALFFYPLLSILASSLITFIILLDVLFVADMNSYGYSLIPYHSVNNKSLVAIR